MSVIITKDDSEEKIRRAIQQATGKNKKEKLALDKYFGKVKFKTKGLEYQKKVRNEWG